MKKNRGTTGIMYVKIRCMGDHHHHMRVVTKGERMMKVVLMSDEGVRWVTSKILWLLDQKPLVKIWGLHERVRFLHTASQNFAGTIIVEMMKAHIENPQLLLISRRISSRLGRINRLLDI